MALHDFLKYLPSNARRRKLAMHANTIAELRLKGASYGIIAAYLQQHEGLTVTRQAIAWYWAQVQARQCKVIGIGFGDATPAQGTPAAESHNPIDPSASIDNSPPIHRHPESGSPRENRLAAPNEPHSVPTFTRNDVSTSAYDKHHTDHAPEQQRSER